MQTNFAINSVITQANSASSYFAKYGGTLIDNGYLPVPIMPGEKRPAISAWQRARLTHDDLTSYPGHGAGVLCGQGKHPLVGVDIDVSHPSIGPAIIDWCRTHLGDTVERVGAAPRVLMVYRASTAGWTKGNSTMFFDPSDPVKPSGKPNNQQVELLGFGQQFVAYHVHPDTGLDYDWTDLYGGLTAMSASSLPIITETQVDALLAEVDRLVRATTGVRVVSSAAAAPVQQGGDLGDLMDLEPAQGWTLDYGRKVLSAIDNDDTGADYDTWLKVGMALHHEYAGSADALQLWRDWGARSSKDNPREYGYKWTSFGKGGKRPTTARWLLKMARLQSVVSLDDFHAYLPLHRYYHVVTAALWPPESVDASAPWPANTDGKKQRPSRWLDANRAVHQMSWLPGRPEIVKDIAVAEGGILSAPGNRVLNLYRAPTLGNGDPGRASPWLNHLSKVYPDNWRHILDWFAHRAQRPHEKCNHAIVLGGAQGIGKDSILEGVRHAVGGMNWQEVGPSALIGRFNGFVKGVVLRVSEARDLGDANRFAIYEASKTLIAAPPESLRVDEKGLREHYIPNLVGVIFTTNHRTDGLYLPPDDRRHYVAWSDLTKDDFDEAYWAALHDWYDVGGRDHVAAFLLAHDLSGFNAKAPPPKTEAFWTMVSAGEAPEDTDVRNLIEDLGSPPALTLDHLRDVAEVSTAIDLFGRAHRRGMPHRLARVGYVPVRNPDAKEGQWRIGGKRQVVYARSDLPESARIAAVHDLMRQSCT